MYTSPDRKRDKSPHWMLSGQQKTKAHEHILGMRVFANLYQ